MSEKHLKTTITTTSLSDVMYAMFTAVKNSGSVCGIVFADNANAPNGSRAINNATTYTSSAAVTSSAYFNATNSFFVIESSASMPSGYKWQAKIQRLASSLTCNLSTIGGWDYAVMAGSVSGTFTSTGSNNPGITPPVSDAVPFMSTNPAANEQVLVSMCNLDGYIGADGSSIVNYCYFRFLRWVPTGQEYAGFTINAIQFPDTLYVGGYVPVNPTGNLNPVCLLAKMPTTAGANAAGYATWGNNGSNNSFSSNCRIAQDYNHSTTVLATASAASIIIPNAASAVTDTYGGTSTAAKDLLGNWVNFPIWIYSRTTAATYGYFGKYTHLQGYLGRADATQDSAGEYLAVNDLMFRWKPTA